MAGQIEGKNPILEALRANHTIDKILISKDIGRHSAVAEILHIAKQKGIPTVYVDKPKLDAISQTGSHQGLIAYMPEKGYVDIEDIVEKANERNENPFIIMLDGIEDPHNLGAILRSAEGAGVHGVVIPKRRAVGLTATVAKTSAGAVEYVPVAKVSNLSDAISKLKKHNIWIVGVEGEGKTSYTKFDFNMPVAIIIGSEGGGIARLVKENCDELVSIPMKGEVSSLNASVAAAVVMYEVLKQREK
ncbi:23S rRNA (guanosine(2251)-2'-O)-methyltransferase RlmB [Candidatus Margulisiibacteriota bacterium]